MNLRGQVTVLEIPGGNLRAAQLLVGSSLVGPGADLAPVTLTFVGEVHHPDLLVRVQRLQVRFHNTGKSYVSAG